MNINHLTFSKQVVKSNVVLSMLDTCNYLRQAIFLLRDSTSLEESNAGRSINMNKRRVDLILQASNHLEISKAMKQCKERSRVALHVLIAAEVLANFAGEEEMCRTSHIAIGI